MRYNDWQQSQEKSTTLLPTAFDTDNPRTSNLFSLIDRMTPIV